MKNETKRLATDSEVNKQIVKLKQYHQRGRDSLESNAPLEIQAVELGWNLTKLLKARLFASEYSQHDLELLCTSVGEHKSVFGTAHVAELVTLRGPLKQYRAELQNKCLLSNWSTEELSNEIQTTLGSRKSQGGRLPHVTAENVLIVLLKRARTVLRLLKHIRKLGILDAVLSKKLRRRVKMLAMELELVISQTAVDLQGQREGK